MNNQNNQTPTTEGAVPETVSGTVLNGAQRIAAERGRQIFDENWTEEHDDAHDNGEMISAAVTYLHAYRMLQHVRPGYGIPQIEAYLRYFSWPAAWGGNWLKVSDDPIRNLEKAGALIAAEIDRLTRLENAQAPSKDCDAS